MQREYAQQHGLRLLLHGARDDALHHYHGQMWFVLQGFCSSLKLWKYNRHAELDFFLHLKSAKTEAVLVTASRFGDLCLFRFVFLFFDDLPVASLPSMAPGLYAVPLAKGFYDVFPNWHFLVSEAERGAVAGHRCAQIFNQFIFICFLIGFFFL